MKRPGLILLLCVLSPIQLSGCSSEDPVQGWGTVAIILDRNPLRTATRCRCWNERQRFPARYSRVM